MVPGADEPLWFLLGAPLLVLVIFWIDEWDLKRQQRRKRK